VIERARKRLRKKKSPREEDIPSQRIILFLSPPTPPAATPLRTSRPPMAPERLPAATKAHTSAPHRAPGEGPAELLPNVHKNPRE